jgi:hypothetical protein
LPNARPRRFKQLPRHLPANTRNEDAAILFVDVPGIWAITRWDSTPFWVLSANTDSTKALAAGNINLVDPQTKAGLDALVAASLVTSAREAQRFAAAAPPTN